MNTVPNIPPVTVHQIVRYLASRYANAMKEARYWARQQATATNLDDLECAANYCGASYDEATVLKFTLSHLKHGSVSTWRIGKKENRP